MAFTLTAATAAISLTLAGILGLWSLGLDVKPKDDKRRYHRIARLCAFIIAILLLVLIWHVASGLFGCSNQNSLSQLHCYYLQQYRYSACAS